MKKHFTIIISIILLFSAVYSYAFRFNNIEFILTGSINETFDDNIVSADENNKKYDIISNFMLGIGLRIETKNTFFELLAHTYQQVYSFNTQFHSNSQDLVMELRSQPTAHDRLEISNEFTHYEEPREFEYEIGRTGGRYDYFRNTFNFSYEHEFNKNFALETFYFNEIFKHTISAYEDSMQNRPRLTFSFPINAFSIISIFYEFTHMRFGNMENNDSGLTTMIHYPGMGFRQYFTKTLYFDCRGGPGIISSYTGRTHIKPEAEASLVFDIDENSLFRIIFSYLTNTNPYYMDITENWRISAVYNHQFLKRLSGSFIVFYGQGKYIENDLDYNLLGLHASLAYDITENIEFSFGYYFRKGDSNEQAGNEYMRNIAYIEFRGEF